MPTVRKNNHSPGGKRRGGRNVEFLYGLHPVLECLRAGRRRVFAIYTADGAGERRLREIDEVARKRGAPVNMTTSAHLKEMGGSDQHQGVAAKVGPYPTTDVTELLEDIAGDPFLLILDRIEDPRNFGALTRTALAAGVHGIVIPRDHAASPTPAVSRSSAGALEHMRICPVVNLVRTIRELRNRNIWTVGLDRQADECLFDADLRGPLAVVVGGEGKGMRPLVRQHCDRMLAIPQAGPVNSLNASVAGALILYEILRQRKTP